MVSHRHLPPARRSRAARATVLSAAATAAAAMGTAPVLAHPAALPAESPEAASGEVDRLFAEAERAVEAFNGSAERVAELEAELERWQHRVAVGQQAVNDQRRTVGSAAAAQYRAGALGPSLALLLAESPQEYLDRATALDRLGTRRAGELGQLRAAQRTLEQRRQEAEQKLRELREEQARLDRHKRAVQRKLASAERQFQRLSAAERAERAHRAEAAAPTPAAERASLERLGAWAPTAGRAAVAVAAAQGAIGLPYAWGQAGPSAFDCSGLIQWAYAQAGVALPRTSQAQAGAGRWVALAQALPGDIVVYRADASHVAMYVGGGQVVHSPHPGAHVRYDPVGMMPVSAVVRP